MGLCYFAIINNVLSGAVLFCYLCYFAITKHSIYSVGLCYFAIYAINNVLIEAVLFCYLCYFAITKHSILWACAICYLYCPVLSRNTSVGRQK